MKQIIIGVASYISLTVSSYMTGVSIKDLISATLLIGGLFGAGYILAISLTKLD